MTLCFTPEHLGIEPHYASPPRNAQDFADFATWAVERYAPVAAARQSLTSTSISAVFESSS